MEQLCVTDCHQNVTETEATGNHKKKYTLVIVFTDTVDRGRLS